MEFALEGILETLLVGTVAGLCVVAFLFLFVPTFLRMENLRRLFKLFMYEEERIRDSSHPLPPQATDETNRLFIGLLLCAGLYGAGLVAESLSDIITSSDFANSRSGQRLMFFSDPEIRIQAFKEVGESALKIGSVSPAFAEFLTDHTACHSRELDGDPSSPSCRVISSRARSFYYSAKNAVFHEQTYFDELSRLQNRIDFTRALAQIIGVLGLLLGMAFLVGLLGEGLHKYRLSHWGPCPAWFLRFHKKLPEFLTDLLEHWTHLAARRCLAMGLFAFFLAWAALNSWRDHEDEFDRRVFGYYLVLINAQAEDGQAPVQRAVLKSSYRVFSHPQAERFEPSAVAAIGDGKTLLIANDKGGRTALGLFHFASDDELVWERDLPLPENNRLEKIESLHARTRDGAAHVLAATAFDRDDPGYRRIVSFVLQPNGEVTDFHDIVTPDPCVLKRGKGAIKKECVIEGLASRDPSKELLLGVRAVGKFGARRYVAAVVKMSFDGARWNSRTLWDYTLAEANTGISGLEISNDDALLVLTSSEIEDNPGSAMQVAGALWRIPPKEIDAQSRSQWNPDWLVARFIHKPEGITVLDNDTMVVVFDDDGRRKSRDMAPETFALNQNESVFTLVRPKIKK